MNIFFNCLFLISASFGYLVTDSDDEKLKQEVENYNISSQLVASLDFPYARDFIELVDDQQKEIGEILKRAQTKSKNIRNSTLSLSEKLKKLSDIKKDQDIEFKNVLLPNQIERLKIVPFYWGICEQGFGNSLINGTLAAHLELSDSQRREVLAATKESTKKYKKLVAKAQAAAVASILESLPAEKREKLDKILRPMYSADKTFWPVNLHHFQTKRRPTGSMFLGLPDLKDQEEEENRSK